MKNLSLVLILATLTLVLGASFLHGCGKTEEAAAPAKFTVVGAGT